MQQCENPKMNCRNAAEVEVKHSHTHDDGTVTTTTLGFLCQACAMKVALVQMRPHLN